MPSLRQLRRRAAGPLLLIALLTPAAWATWSIVAVDTRTGEVAVASATCLTGMNLERFVPVIVVERGGAAAQSAIDANAQNRRRIRDNLRLGMPPEDILALLSRFDGGHEFRQYGMADMAGRALTFSGSQDGAWAGGVTGRVGSIVYAIQGNVLTGQPVILQAEQAFVTTGGDLSQRVMAAMEGARSMGGDGRCSCSQGNPPGCGSPPPQFDKAAHIGFVIVSRPGDVNGVCGVNQGCANGDYYLNLNVAGAGASAPDPVFTLQKDYKVWRLGQAGRPDAVHSAAAAVQASVTAGAAVTWQIEVDLADIEGAAIGHGGAAVSIEHDARSAGGSVLDTVADHGDGTYTLTLSHGPEAGVDRVRVIVDDGIRPVTIWPPVTFVSSPAPPAPYNDLEPVPGLDDPAALDRHGKLLPDGLTAYLLTTRDGRPKRLMRATRPAPAAPFGPAADVPGLNDFSGRFSGFWISDDELKIVFSAALGSQPVERLYASRRALSGDPFDPPHRIPALNSGFGDAGPWVAANGLELYFHSGRPGGGGGGLDLWVSRRFQGNGFWLPPEPLTSLNTAADESYPVLAAGDTRLFFARNAAARAEDICFADRDPAALFQPDAPLPGALHPGPRAAAADLVPGGPLWVSRGDPSGGADLLRAHPTPGALTATGTSISVAAGGAVDFTLDAGPAWGGAAYALVLGGSGAVPGARILDAVLPLAADGVTALSRARANLPPFLGFAGHLDTLGRATARFELPAGAPVDPAFLHRSYLAAFAAVQGGRAFASNATTFELLP